MRVWVMENGLQDETGHHFNNSLGLREACAGRGLETRFLVHRQADPAVIRALDARPVFRYRPYDQSSADPLAGPLECLITQGNAFAEGLAAAAAEGLAHDDLLLVPTTLQNELYGCAVGLHGLSPARRPLLAVNFIVENFFALGTRLPGPVAPLYRYAARMLGRMMAPGRVLYAANGRGMAEHLAQVLAQPVTELPMPKSYPAFVPGDSAAGGEPPCVAVLGHSRLEKGFELLPELVARNRGLRFLIQISPPGAERWWPGGGIDPHAAPNAQVVRGALDRDAYHALMTKADLVLLPYDAEQVPLRTSGVFSEAVAAGRACVVPQRTWMEEQLARGRGAGVGFSACTVQAISVALEQACARLPELRLRALECAPAWRREQSVAAYLDGVLRHFGAAPPKT